MKFQQNGDILFCVLLLEVRQQSFWHEEHILGGGGEKETITLLQVLIC